MKVLFALSQIEVTGAETYALSLASALRERGHEIVFVSDRLSQTAGFKFYPLPIHTQNTSTLGRIKNVFALKKIIAEEKIQIVHSHSRAANLISHFAVGRKIPMVVTVHGRWRNHFAFRALPCLGNKTIAVCPYLQRYLIQDIAIPESSVVMVPNGIDTSVFCPMSNVQSQNPKILFVGRFSGQKGNVIRFLIQEIFPKIVQDFPALTIEIISFSVPDADQQMIRDFNKRFGRKLIELNANQSLVSVYSQASVVIGSGRVALEAMACGKPVVAVGESSAPGLLSQENFGSAFDSNFGDCGEWNLFKKENTLANDLTKILQSSQLRGTLGAWGRNIVLNKFDSKQVAKEVEHVYENSF